MGRQYAFRFNVLHKPFDNPLIRQAVAIAFNPEDFVKSTIGDPDYYVLCKSLFPCGSPLAMDAGFTDRLEGNIARARALIQQAGYDGSPVVLMQSTDNPSLSNLAPVAKAIMERAGLKVRSAGDGLADAGRPSVASRPRRQPAAGAPS